MFKIALFFIFVPQQSTKVELISKPAPKQIFNLLPEKTFSALV